MKTIGLIGGMSWESSKVYYELINKRVNELAGGSHSAKSILVSVDFSQIEQLSEAGKWEEIGRLMADSAKSLENSGADIILLCTNTIHIVSEFITRAVKIPFLHIADATGEAIVSQEVKKIALLGTKFTMEKDFYKKTLVEKYDLEVTIPNAADRKVLHDIIYQELVKGIFSDPSRSWLTELIKVLIEEGVEGAILGCTELPILLQEKELDIPTFDTGKLHAFKAVEWALNQA